jgi:hypothetical protein
VNPEFPIYIPSKGRAANALTPRLFNRIGVPYRMVVEEQQRESYEKHFAPESLITLDPIYQRNYETLDEFGDTKPKGSGPARNFIWEHSISEGWEWHWIMDDNIREFCRYHKNARVPFSDGTPIRAMEDFTTRYKNVAMAGPNYYMFLPSREKAPPFITGTRIYSCNLIRNDLPFRWRGRYNEDTDLSLVMLKAGWATILFNAILAWKITTQKLTGGNTTLYAADGTLPKSELLARAHPDLARVVKRYGRWHHHVDYSPFRGQELIYRDDYTPPSADVKAYPMKIEHRGTVRYPGYTEGKDDA